MIPFPFQSGGFGRTIVQPAGSPGGYLYVRINVTANGGDALDQVTEMEVAETAGGTNVCTGGTPSASNTYLTFSASKAFDGIKNNNDDSWAGNGTKPYWLRYQFPSAKVIAEVRLWGPSVASIWDRGPKDFTIQGSNDGTNWTTLKTLTGELYTSEFEQKTYVI